MEKLLNIAPALDIKYKKHSKFINRNWCTFSSRQTKALKSVNTICIVFIARQQKNIFIYKERELEGSLVKIEVYDKIVIPETIFYQPTTWNERKWVTSLEEENQV